MAPSATPAARGVRMRAPRGWAQAAGSIPGKAWSSGARSAVAAPRSSATGDGSGICAPPSDRPTASGDLRGLGAGAGSPTTSRRPEARSRNPRLSILHWDGLAVREGSQAFPCRACGSRRRARRSGRRLDSRDGRHKPHRIHHALRRGNQRRPKRGSRQRCESTAGGRSSTLSGIDGGRQNELRAASRSRSATTRKRPPPALSETSLRRTSLHGMYSPGADSSMSSTRTEPSGTAASCAEGAHFFHEAGTGASRRGPSAAPGAQRQIERYRGFRTCDYRSPAPGRGP